MLMTLIHNICSITLKITIGLPYLPGANELNRLEFNATIMRRGVMEI